MALTVETGAGLASADAFDSLANVMARWTSKGRDFSSYDGDQREQAIRRATEWLSASFAWKGYRVNGRDQALAWPRHNVSDEEGWDVSSTSVPLEVRQATADAAWQELTSPHSLTPVVTPINQKVLTEVKGIKWQYLGRGGVHNSVPVLTSLRSLIGGLLEPGAGNGLSGLAIRR